MLTFLGINPDNGHKIFQNKGENFEMWKNEDGSYSFFIHKTGVQKDDFISKRKCKYAAVYYMSYNPTKCKTYRPPNT
jgi:hypothetical protein